MTTEATFAAALDADPTDWQTRLVFSDWLLDRGDMRWEGMRWLGMNRKWPDNLRLSYPGFDGWRWYSDECEHPDFEHRWCHYLGKLAYDVVDPVVPTKYSTRAEAENAFCRAYPALAAAHPAEFAVGVMA